MRKVRKTKQYKINKVAFLHMKRKKIIKNVG